MIAMIIPPLELCAPLNYKMCLSVLVASHCINQYVNLQTQYCGICHSDVHVWDKSLSPKLQVPIVLGRYYMQTCNCIIILSDYLSINKPSLIDLMDNQI